MPEADRARYVNAVVALYKKGDIQTLAQKHWDSRDQVYGTGILHFLIWHRVFLNDFEQRLRALPGFECVTVPFWTYDYSATPSDRRSLFGTSGSRLGQADQNGCIGGAFAAITQTLNGSTASCISRSPDQALLGSLSNAVFTDLIQLSEPNFATFSDSLQNTHGLPHVACGGLMATHYSPMDPAFFVHHSNIDRMFSIWQDCHQNYQWTEAQGLKQPILAYPGVTAGDFIDNKKYMWNGKSQSVEYANNALGNPSQYSSDFRQRIVTSCQGGGLSRSSNQVAPILGLDDSWATRAGGIIGGGSTPATKDVTLTCASDTGTADLARLPMAPLAVYDNLVLQECVIRCGNFYFKKSGASNCVCLSFSSGGSSSVKLDAAVNRYIASCGTGATYGLYQPSGTSGLNRRLLQLLQQRPLLQQQPLSQQQPIIPPMSVAGSASMGSATSNGGGSNAMGQSSSGQGGSSTSSAISSSDATGSSSQAMSSSNAAAAQNTSNNMGQNDARAPNATQNLNQTRDFNNTNWNATDANSGNWNSSNLNQTRIFNDTNWNATSANWNSTKANSNSSVCFNAFAPSGPRVERACSSKASTPPPLPRSWMLMNRLNPDNADTCKLFKPATGTKSIDCIQNRN